MTSQLRVFQEDQTNDYRDWWPELGVSSLLKLQG